MLDALKTLFENDVVSEDVRASIEDAWNKKIQENKQQATAELREEFAQKYEHDKRNMIDAIDSTITALSCSYFLANSSRSSEVAARRFSLTFASHASSISRRTSSLTTSFSKSVFSASNILFSPFIGVD